MFFKLIIIALIFHISSVFAATVDCEPSTSQGGNNYDKWSEIHVPFELMPGSVNVTVGSNIPDYSVLYTFKQVAVMVESGSCNNSNMWVDFGMLSMPVLVNTVSGKKIYSTDVQGIGVSINDPVHSNWAYDPYPKTEGDIGVISAGTVMYVEVTFWKIPGAIVFPEGPITVNGPEMGIFYSNWSYTLTTQNPSRIYQINSGGSDYKSGPAYLAGSRMLRATFIFQPGTCSIEGNNVNVSMGNYDGSNGHSLWKDASFKLICPDGYGYGGTYDTTKKDPYSNPYNISPGGTYVDNNKSNGRVQVSIVPYTETIDANKGILALDGTGAQGYGIQLAWAITVRKMPQNLRILSS